MPGGQEPQTVGISTASDSSTDGHTLGKPYLLNPLLQGSRSLTMELLSLLPSREVAALLVDTYFDRVHWFMLIFHQEDFRQSWKTLYDTPFEDLVQTCPNPGLISAFLVVIAIALQYTGKHRQQILESQNAHSTLLKDNILSTIRSRLLDIVAMGSIEAIQTCVLLGTYYLYHGSPNLAWPVCGCGLRIAQALNLHRKLPVAQPMSPQLQRKIETRKRCWWAIYEIETFCSISYGYPHGIRDTDCDVDLLDPLATSASQSSPASFNEAHQCPASLLSYKYLMSKLSVLLKDVLHDLYGIGSHEATNRRERKGLLRKVPALDRRLQKWKAEMPDPLSFDKNMATNYASAEEMDCDIGASGPGFERHVYQHQALALALAYENARILIHRPLLTYRTNTSGNSEWDNPADTSTKDILRLSLQACRDAAMNTSHIGESPIFSLAAATYAAAFISIHTFTAGVVLCILTSIDPLTPESHESKMGLRRLLAMQAHLKSESQSALAAQGLEILERLTRLVMEKELKEMLASGNDVPGQSSTTLLHENQELPENYEGHSGQPTAEASQAGAVPDVIEDPVISQALFDLDQVLSGQDLNLPLDPLFNDLNGPNNGFTQEQAWIWGMDNFSQFFDIP